MVAGLALILINGFFLAIEFAVTRAQQFSEQAFTDGTPALELAWEMTNNFEIYLTTCQVGITEISAPPMTLAAETNVSDAFDQFQAEDQELALVLEDGEVVGLLTATNALEAVMGELEGPLDQQAST